MSPRKFIFSVLMSVVACLMLAAAANAQTGNITLAGKIGWFLSPTAFVYETGHPHGYVRVLYTASMVVPAGSQLAVGQTVTVTGTWDLQQHIVASQVALAAGGPYHITTWAYDFASGHGSAASGASVRQFVTYAEGDSKALNDCHSVPGSCAAVFYFDAGHETQPGPGCNYMPDQYVMQAASESWFLHLPGYTDSAHRVYGKWPNGCIVYAMNPNSTGLQAWFRNYLQTTAASYDAYFSDSETLDIPDTGWFTSHGGCNPWPHMCTAFQEFPNDGALIAGRANFMKSLTFSNGTPMYAVYQQAHIKDPSYDLAAFSSASNFIGASCEGCVAGMNGAPVSPARYAEVLNDMAAINATAHGSFVLISTGNYPAGSASQLLQRVVTTGIAWLAYSQGHTIVWPDLENSSNSLSIWPEDLIYPSSPLETMATGASDLQVAPNVYRREFANCYQQGISFGHCAAVVNASASTVSVQAAWLKQAYGHVITISGGDVLSSGIANAKGAPFVAGVTAVGAGGAILLSQ